MGDDNSTSLAEDEMLSIFRLVHYRMFPNLRSEVRVILLDLTLNGTAGGKIHVWDNGRRYSEEKLKMPHTYMVEKTFIQEWLL